MILPSDHGVLPGDFSDIGVPSVPGDSSDAW